MNFLRGLTLIVTSFSSIVLITPSAHADSVIYTFSGINSGPLGDGLPVALQFTAPAFITSLTPVFAPELTSCTNCLVSTTIPAAEFRPHDTIGDAIGFVDLNKEFFYRFPTGAFSAPGTYSTLSQSFPGTLTVSTPENGTLALLECALLGVFTVGRRKLLLG